jgi:hypothetical protein
VRQEVAPNADPSIENPGTSLVHTSDDDACVKAARANAKKKQLLYDASKSISKKHQSAEGTFSHYGYCMGKLNQYQATHADSIIELFQNAAGAQPKNISISWETLETGGERIRIVDDGKGMNLSQGRRWGRVFDLQDCEYGNDTNCGVSKFGEGTYMVALNECDPNKKSDYLAVCSKKQGAPGIENCIVPFNFIRGESCNVQELRSQNYRPFLSALKDLPKPVGEKAKTFQEMTSEERLPPVQLESDEYRATHGTVTEIIRSKQATTEQERKDVIEQIEFKYRSKTAACSKNAAPSKKAAQIITYQLEAGREWQELKPKPFLNETNETPVEIRFEISPDGKLAIANIKHLTGTAATGMEVKMRQLEGPYTNGAKTSDDMDADAILRISCRNEFGNQTARNDKETKRNKMIFHNRMRVIKKTAPKLADGFMVGLMAPTWEMKFGNIQQTNEGCMSQIRSRAHFSKGDNIRFEFLVGPALHSVALDLKSIKNLSDPKLNKIPGLEEYLYKLVVMVFKVRKGGRAHAVAVDGTRSPTSSRKGCHAHAVAPSTTLTLAVKRTRSPTSSCELASSEEGEDKISRIKRRKREASKQVNIARERENERKNCPPTRKRPTKKKKPQNMSKAKLSSDGREYLSLAANKSKRPEFQAKSDIRQFVTQTFPHLKEWLRLIKMFPLPQRPRKERKSEGAGSALV